MSPSFVARTAAIALLAALIFAPGLFRPLLAPFADNGAPAIYDRASLAVLTFDHLALVAVSSLIATLIAAAAGVFVTRKSGAEFLPLSLSIANIGQTFPPVAVLALAVPAVGFGVKPTVIALVLYGLLPIFENTVAGLRQTPSAVLEAADGMGMGARRRLVSVELPLALPVILAGVRISVIINLGTATIGSTVAAKGLGEVIIAGLSTSNTAFVIQGGVIVALLAVLIYDALGFAERAAARRAGRMAGYSPH
jgi:osmoprotectant transport system permease protein